MSEMLRILERGYELVWREDRLDDALIGLGPDFEWIVPNFPDGEVRRGADAVIDFFRDWRDGFEDLEVGWELHDAGGQRVLALTSMTGRGGVSGVPVEMRFAQVWTFREGRAVRMVMADSPLLALARDAIETFRRDGADAVLAFHTEDVVWEEDPDWPDGEVWHGREGVRAVFAERLESTAISAEVEGVFESGRRVLILMRWTAEGLGSGATAVQHPALISEFEGWLVKRVRFFLDRERARAAFEAA
jgi:ketosteroid isomerase-like protein